MPTPNLLSKSLLDNLIYFKGIFDECMDFMLREFTITGTKAAFLAIDGLVNKQVIAQGILNPILKAPILELTPDEKFNYIRDNALATADQTQLVSRDDIVDRLMSGFAVLLLDGCSRSIAFGVQGFQMRSISEPSGEVMQRGSREGFVEPYLINISMIRRRMRTPDLKFERMIIGSTSQTSVAICYLNSAVSKELLARVRAGLRRIDLPSVFASGYLSPFLENKSIFNGAGLSERPDTVCGKIMEGRVAIIIDGTPNVMVVPHLFVENFQSFDDYTTRPFYATFTRILKYIAFFLAMFLPGFYVAVVTFHPELLPEALLSKVAQAEATTPFPIALEAIVIHLIYEIMREAGLRVPRPLSHAVSIVGALVIGDTAVSAGLIGAPTLFIVAMTALSGYVTPDLYQPIAICRFLFIVIGGICGLWGVMLGFGFVMINICAESVYGMPFSAPISPFSLRGMRDVVIRASWKILGRRTEHVQDLPGAHIKKY